MRQYAIVGLGSFGAGMLAKLAEVSKEIMVIDRDAEAVERVKDLAQAAFVVDAFDDATLSRLVPEGLDVAIVDIRDSIESAILATNSLKKLGVQEILVRADNEERGEVFSLVGATRVVYPDREAASRIVPILVSPALFSFMPIGSNFVMAEVQAPDRYVGLSLVEANLRQRHGINVVAVRLEGSQEYRYFDSAYRLSAVDVLLIVGTEDNVISFSGRSGPEGQGRSGDLLRSLLKGRARNGN